MAVRPSTYIIGILVFTAFIMAGTTFMGTLRESDPTYADDTTFSDFNNTFNVYDEASGEIGTLGAGLTNSTTDFGDLGVLNALIMSAWQSLRLLLSSFGFMNAVFGGLSTVLGVPAWVGGLIILGVTVMFVFSIWAAFFQRDL